MKHLLLVSFLFISLNAFSQSQSPYAWLTGTWKGAGFGGVFEEVWSEPDATGTLMGMFRYSDSSGVVQFYEFWVLDATGMKLKHFTPEFIGWEEKEGFIDFKMNETTATKVALKGLIYEKISENEMKISLTLKQGDKIETEIFNLKRQLRP